MRAVVQRVSAARVLVDGEVVGQIGRGLLAFCGALDGDSIDDANFIGRKLAGLRVFPDDGGKMNLNVKDADGGVLLVSQFTLAANTTSGTRPSFSSAMEPAPAQQLLERLAGVVRAAGIVVETGRFGEKMSVEAVNDGPVTIILDSRNKVK